MLFFALSAHADKAIIVLEEAPETYQKIDDVGANSRASSARTSNAKQSFVIREMQRQAAAMGANAIVITEMREWKQVKPVYGRRPGSMQYEDVINFQGTGMAITVDPALLESAQTEQEAGDGS